MSSTAATTSATQTVTTPTKPTSDSASQTATTPTKAATTGSGSAASTPSKEVDEARTHLTQGRRHLLVRDYFSAVASLAKGCELLAVRFGDTGPELGDAYLTYGRALLELARSERGVLDMNEDGEDMAEEDGEGDDDEEGEGEEDGEDGEGDEEDKEEDGKSEEVDDKEGKAESAANGEEAKTTNGKEGESGGSKVESANGDKDGSEAEADAPKANGEAKAKANGTLNGDSSKEAASGPDEADDTLKAEDGEEDVNNLQLAWEVLELAKGIFEKQLEAEGEAEAKQISLKLADVHLKLGEVGIESESYSMAIEDIQKSLEIQRRFLDADDRRIAESLYQLGLAYSLANEYDSAIEQYKMASDQIEKRIASLEKKAGQPSSDDNSLSDDPFYSLQGEIEELKGLLPEMKARVADMQETKKVAVRRVLESLAEVSAKQSSTADGAGPSTASDKPVSSIAHLVKRKPKEQAQEVSSTEVTDKAPETEKQDSPTERKRKPEDDVTSEDKAKKVKTDVSDSTPSE